MILTIWAVIAIVVLMSALLIYMEHEQGFVLGGSTAVILIISYFSAEPIMRSPVVVLLPQVSKFASPRHGDHRGHTLSAGAHRDRLPCGPQECYGKEAVTPLHAPADQGDAHAFRLLHQQAMRGGRRRNELRIKTAALEHTASCDVPFDL